MADGGGGEFASGGGGERGPNLAASQTPGWSEQDVLAKGHVQRGPGAIAERVFRDVNRERSGRARGMGPFVES